MKYFVFWKVERHLTYIGTTFLVKLCQLLDLPALQRSSTIVGMGGGGYA